MVTVRNFNLNVTFDDTYATTTIVESSGDSYNIYLLRISPTDGYGANTQLDWPSRKVFDTATAASQSESIFYDYFNTGVETGTLVSIKHWTMVDPSGNQISNTDIGDSCLYITVGDNVLYITGAIDEVFDNGFDYDLYIGASSGSTLTPITDKPFVVALPSAVTSDSNFTQFFTVTPTHMVWTGSGFMFCRSPGAYSSTHLSAEPRGHRSRFATTEMSNYPNGTPSLAAITSSFGASPNANGASLVTTPRGGRSAPVYADATVPTGGSATLYVAEVTDSGYTKSSYPLIFSLAVSGSEDLLELYLGPNGNAADYDDEQNALQSATYLMVWWVESANATQWSVADTYGLDISDRGYIPDCPASTVVDAYNGIVADGSYPSLSSDEIE